MLVLALISAAGEGGSGGHRARTPGHPPQHPDLTTPDRGVVREVLVRSGERVEAGQALVVLDPRVQRSEVAELRSRLDAEISRQQSAKPAFVSASAASSASSTSTNGCWHRSVPSLLKAAAPRSR